MKINNIHLQTINNFGYNDFTMVFCDILKNNEVITDVAENLDIKNYCLSNDSNIDINEDRLNDTEKEEVKEALNDWLNDNLNDYIKIDLDADYYMLAETGAVFTEEEIKEQNNIFLIEHVLTNEGTALEITENLEDGEQTTYTMYQVYPRFWDSSDANSEDWSDTEIACCYRD